MKAKIIRRMDIAQLNISYIFMQCLQMVEYTWVPSHLQTHTLYKKSTLPGTNYVFMVLFCCCCCFCCFFSWGTNHVISCQFHMNYIIWLVVLCCYRIILKEITSNIGSILGPLLFLLYINDLSTVSNDCFSVLFADDTNMFVTEKNTSEMCVKLNNDLQEICEWLRCNKLSLNILKTHYMIYDFTTKNKTAQDLDIKISNTAVERVYDTKFLGVYIDAQLTWKRHIEYTCSKLSKCAGILLKARKN